MATARSRSAPEIKQQFLESEDSAGVDASISANCCTGCIDRSEAARRGADAVRRSAARAARSGRIGHSDDRHVRAAASPRHSVSRRDQRSGRSLQALRRHRRAQVRQRGARSRGARDLQRAAGEAHRVQRVSADRAAHRSGIARASALFDHESRRIRHHRSLLHASRRRARRAARRRRRRGGARRRRADRKLVVAMDTIVEGVHFPVGHRRQRTSAIARSRST